MNGPKMASNTKKAIIPTLAMARLSRLSLRIDSWNGVAGFFFFSCSSFSSFSLSVVASSLSVSNAKPGSNCIGLIPESGAIYPSPVSS